MAQQQAQAPGSQATQKLSASNPGAASEQIPTSGAQADNAAVIDALRPHQRDAPAQPPHHGSGCGLWLLSLTCSALPLAAYTVKVDLQCLAISSPHSKCC